MHVLFYMAKPTDPAPEHTFESALERLESLVSDMEGDRMPLEELIVAYEEGTKLVKICQQKLSDAEKKIEIIQKRATGEPELKEFEPGQKPAAPAPPTSSGAKDVSLF
jgi:exodeoxyribonuclease VII small subunit